MLAPGCLTLPRFRRLPISPMPDELRLVVVVSGVAALASVAGGLLALWHRTSTLISSLAFGCASGALIGTVTLEMLPTALDLGALPAVVVAFVAGMLAIFAFDLVVHGGRIEELMRRKSLMWSV